MNTERDDQATTEDMEVQGDQSPPLEDYMVGITAWQAFERSIRETNRHLSSEASYLMALLDGCQSSVVTLPHGAEYSRARIHPLGEQENATNPLGWFDLGAPPPGLREGGRLNPDGISYLYLSDTDDTAIAESRPWRDARVTVGRFSLVADSEVVDLRSPGERFDPVDPVFWAAFALSRPTHRDDRFSYVATQLLAGHLDHLGLEGILYDSSLRPAAAAHNLALFRRDRAIVKEAQLYAVDETVISSSPIGSPLVRLL